MNLSLRNQLEQAETVSALADVWIKVLAAKEENMSENTFKKCERVYETKVDSFQGEKK